MQLSQTGSVWAVISPGMTSRWRAIIFLTRTLHSQSGRTFFEPFISKARRLSEIAAFVDVLLARSVRPDVGRRVAGCLRHRGGQGGAFQCFHRRHVCGRCLRRAGRQAWKPGDYFEMWRRRRARSPWHSRSICRLKPPWTPRDAVFFSHRCTIRHSKPWRLFGRRWRKKEAPRSLTCSVRC